MRAALYLADVREAVRDLRGAEEKMAAIDPERMKRIALLRREEDRRRALAAGLLLREILGDMEISHGEHGKPRAPHGPHFNLSHSGNRVALAVAETPVGVDIEEHADADCLALAQTAFHEDEQAFLRQAPLDARAQTFYRLWTLKESYLKMRGVGLSVEPSGFAVKIDGSKAVVLSDPQPRLRHYALEGYSAALCVLGAECPEAFEEVVIG